MKIRMLVDQESPKYGPLKKGQEYDLDPEDERLFIERGIAENISAPAYVSKSSEKKKKIEEVKNDV
ncbi:hypothetical protein KAR91_77580 [Candidatus Pacearchaeota archaeon]|nr:hypothetical protein [Candidatus Pacearchaeota archaeon]